MVYWALLRAHVDAPQPAAAEQSAELHMQLATMVELRLLSRVRPRLRLLSCCCKQHNSTACAGAHGWGHKPMIVALTGSRCQGWAVWANARAQWPDAPPPTCLPPIHLQCRALHSIDASAVQYKHQIGSSMRQVSEDPLDNPRFLCNIPEALVRLLAANIDLDLNTYLLYA